MATKGRRTRGARSCLKCRNSKQRCEQLDLAALVPSEEPLPPHMACRRCRVLQLPCIVTDELPKSTRLRIERSQSQRDLASGGNGARNGALLPSASTSQLPMTSDGPLYGSHSGGGGGIQAPSLSRYHPYDATRGGMPPSSAAASRYPPFPPPSFASPGQSSQSPAAANGYPRYERRAEPSYPSPRHTTLPSLGATHGMTSPASSGGARMYGHQASTTGSNFELQVFDPLPALGGGHAYSTPQAPTPLSSSYNGGGRPYDHDSPRHTLMRPLGAPRSAAPPMASPLTPSAESPLEAGGVEASWFYRARISTRCTQILEHMIGVDPCTAGPPSILPPSEADQQRLQELVKRLLSDVSFRTRIDRRMVYVQSSVPFMPNFTVLMENVDEAAFLIGTVMYVEGKMLASDANALQDLLAPRCAYLAAHPPETLLDICAAFVVSHYCPLLMPTESLPDIAGHALLTSARQGSYQLGHATGPARLAQLMDSHHAGHAPPSLDSTEVQLACTWVFMSLQEDALDLIDPPMVAARRQQGRTLHSASYTGVSRSTPHRSEPLDTFHVPRATEEDILAVERYCRALIEHEAPDPNSHRSRQLYGDGPRPAPPPIAFRVAQMLVLLWGAHQLKRLAGFVHTTAEQFDTAVMPVHDAAARTHALRRWTDQSIDLLAFSTADLRKVLQDTLNYLDARGLVSPNQIKWYEITNGTMELLALNTLKDKLYLAGRTFFGVQRTSQEFLFAIFQRPALLKSYEHLGVARVNAAKHVLTLFGNLIMDLHASRRSERIHGEEDGLPQVDPAETRARRDVDNGPMSKWGALAYVFPTSRWSGLFVCCATTCVEELAGRFMAQEAPWGARGESRLEVYQMVLRQTYDTLVLIEEDYLSRYHARRVTNVDGQEVWQEAHQVRLVQTTLMAFEKLMAAIADWQKKASGIGTTSAAVSPQPAPAPLLEFDNALLRDILYEPIPIN